MIIDRPGVFDGVPLSAYHGRITPEPALSSSGARAIIDECPAYYRHFSEINPDRPVVTKKEFDIGNATHLLVLEPEQFHDRVIVVQHDDYQTKAAREARDEARAHGYIPLLVHEFAAVQKMRDAVANDPVAQHAFAGAAIERTYVWRDPVTDRWMKCRPDATPANGRYGVDLKTSTSANPKAFARAITNLGYHQQGAWCLEGMREGGNLDVTDRFAFIVVATKEPHLVSRVWLDTEDLYRGQALNRRATTIFHRCASAGWGREHWPSYQEHGAETVSQSEWARRQQDELISAPIEGVAA